MSFIAASLRHQCFVTIKTVTRELPKCASCYQTVRWRKPRWVPVSASKEFYVRTPTIFDPEETAELSVRVPLYNTSMKAIRRFLAENYQPVKKQRSTISSQDTVEQEEYDRLMEENRHWNERVAVQRELRQAEEKEEIQARIERRVVKKLQLREQEEEKASIVLQTYMNEADCYISLESLDGEIEKLLNSRKDYNYAIDTDGNKVTDPNDKNSQPESKE